MMDQSEAATLLLLTEEALLATDPSVANSFVSIASSSLSRLSGYDQVMQLGGGFTAALSSNSLEARAPF